MKRIITVILALCILCAFPAAAVSLESYGLSLDLPEKYTVLTPDNIAQNAEFLEQLGHTVQSMNKYFSDNKLILFASDRANGRQIQVKRTETDFTKQLVDLSLLSESQVLEFATDILPEEYAANYTVVKLGELCLYEIDSVHTDNIGQFCSRQYVTIRDGCLYSLTFFENGEKMSADFLSEVDSALSTLDIKQTKKVTATDAESITEVVIVWLLIALVAVLAAVMLIGLVRDAVKNSGEEEKTVINRRKYK